MTIQTLIQIATANQENVLIIAALLVVVYLIFKASVKRLQNKRTFKGYYDAQGRFHKVANSKAKTPGSNGSEWHGGSYDGRRSR